MQPTAPKHDYPSFVTKQVADQTDGVWTTQDILQEPAHPEFPRERDGSGAFGAGPPYRP